MIDKDIIKHLIGYGIERIDSDDNETIEAKLEELSKNNPKEAYHAGLLQLSMLYEAIMSKNVDDPEREEFEKCLSDPGVAHTLNKLGDAKMDAYNFRFLESLSVVYDTRVAFLSAMTNYLSQDKQEKRIIVEAGCGPGIDLNHFATRFPNNDFKGFDIDNQFLRIAKDNRKRLGLKNVWFEESDSLATPSHSKEVADILYEHNGLILDFDSQIRLMNSLSQRIKKGGILIIHRSNENLSEIINLHAELSKKGLMFLEDKEYYNNGGSNESLIFYKKCL